MALYTENKRGSKGLKIGHYYLLVAAVGLLLGIGAILAQKQPTKQQKETEQNRGKIQIYKLQEIESFKRFEAVQLQIDSLNTIKDSIVYTQLKDLKGERLQSKLNEIFNQNAK